MLAMVEIGKLKFLLCGYGLIIISSAPVRFAQTVFIDVNCAY